MHKFFAFAVFGLLLVSCGSKKSVTKSIEVSEGGQRVMATTTEVEKTEMETITTITREAEKITKNSNKDKLENIIDYAKTFEGTRYKFGGTTEKGMDCSGLVYTCFLKESVELPRRSRDMATKGIAISLDEATEGDLVFFKTNGSKNAISHVGIIIGKKAGEIRFIHSTTQRGVIVSSMEEPYWKDAFAEVRRLI